MSEPGGGRTPGPGPEFEVTTGPAVAGGRCLARHHGKVVLVAGALPGERVRVRVTRDAARHAEAEASSVLEAHPRRRSPPCPHAAACGGCDYQHAERDLQLELKRSIVRDAFRRIARLDVEPLIEGPAAVPEFRERRRVRLTADPEGRPGFLRRGSHRVEPIGDCLLAPEPLGQRVLPWLGTLPGWRRAAVHFGDDRRAVVLLDSAPGAGGPLREALRAAPPPRPIRGVLVDGRRAGGRRELSYRAGGRRLNADATSFFQSHATGTDELVRIVNAFLDESLRGTLIDLYAGVGLFAAVASSGFGHVLAVERDRRALRHLRANLRWCDAPAEAWATDVESALRELPEAPHETLVVDPPRTGLSPVARERLIARRPERIVSVSCDPATGARDVGHLVHAGWRLRRLAIVDLFPATAHVETAALLVRN